MKNKAIESELLVEKPIIFTMEYAFEKRRIFGGKIKRVIRTRKYSLYPPTTGKIKALSAILAQINIDEQALQKDTLKEGLRIARESADLTARAIAIALRNTKEEIQDEEGIAKDAEFIKWHARPESMASLLLIAITQSDYQSLVSVIRLSQKIWSLSEGIEKTGGVE